MSHKNKALHDRYSIYIAVHYKNSIFRSPEEKNTTNFLNPTEIKSPEEKNTTNFLNPTEIK